MRALWLLVVLALAACGATSPRAVRESAPRLSGPPVVGQTLTTSTGTWANSPTSYAYQWQRCTASCSAIAGASAPAYTVVSADVGDTLDVVVTARNLGGTASQTSAPTAVVTTGTACTTTLSSLAGVNAALTSGAVVCLAAGTYGSVSLTASPASNATLTAVPGAHVVLGGVNVSGSRLTVSQLHVTGSVNLSAGASSDVIDHNDVGPTSGYGISIPDAVVGNPSSNDTVSWNRVHDTTASGEGDALRFGNAPGLTVIGNDVYAIKECAALNCHTDVSQFYDGGWSNGIVVSGVTITKNYVHDTTDAQGLPFLKDGDYTGVSITDNLSVRMASAGEVTGMTIQENTPGLVIRNNTYWGTSGSAVQAGGKLANPSILLDHNVFDQFNYGGSAHEPITSSLNVFGQAPWSWSMSASDVVQASPAFKCAPACGNGTMAGDDYRLASNPNGIGIDWSPAARSYGPAS